MIAAVAAAVLGAGVPVAAQSDPLPAQEGITLYLPPSDGEVVDPFRPPPHIGAAGNRGLEYDTRPGSAVRAAAAGVVTFAGQVGGRRHVTVLHADGVRTSYSFLASVAVRAGQAVAAGAVLGTAGRSLHFGARIGEAYVDPAVLLGDDGGLRLVPVTGRSGIPPPRSLRAPGRAGPGPRRRRAAGRLTGGLRACPIRTDYLPALSHGRPSGARRRLNPQPMGRRPWHLL